MRRLALLLALAALAAGCGGGSEEAAAPGKRPLSTSRQLTPTAHLFGGFVRARVDVIVERARLDPDRVRVGMDFLPYRIQTGVRRSREDFGGFTRLSYEVTLRCITVACVPQRLQSVLGAQEARGERRTFRFKPAHVYYDDPKTKKVRHLKRVWWPALDAISRLSPEFQPSPPGTGPGGDLQSTLVPLPQPSYRLPPPLLAALLVAAALGLLAIPAAVLVRALRRRRPAAEARRAPTPLEVALARVEHARDHGDAEARREALEALAFVLDGDGRADRVRALAWRPAAPEPAATTELLDELRGADGAPA